MEIPWSILDPMRVITMVAFENQTLDIPSTCPDSIRNLIETCWQRDPAKRPSFATIINSLDSISEDTM